jgi:outer membrane protein assembly factor BamB
MTSPSLLQRGLLWGFLSLLALSAHVHAQLNWPGFRGPGARGVGEDGKGLPDKWSTTENVAWKLDIPGRGWSSPVVWGDSVFITTVINTGESEAPKKGLYFGGDRLNPPTSVHQWKVICLDLSTGKVRWERQVHEGQPKSSMHIKSSYASETAVTDGQRVYFSFGNLGIFCFDFEGNELWRRDIKPFKTRNGWGTAASPAIHDGRLYFCYDNEEASYIQALDAKTGSEIWRKDREEKSNWSTPYIWQHDGKTEIVTPGSGQVRSYDLDGNILWTLKGMSSITIGTPYQFNELLIVSSGYVMDPKRPVYAIKPGASGDISLTDGQTSNQFIAWSQPKAAPYNPSTIVYKDRLYVLYDRGTLGCFDAKTGSEVYGMKRLQGGTAFTTSPWAYDGKVFCLSEDGTTSVVKAGDEFEILHTNSLAEDDMGMASPAIVGDMLLIRTAARIYCIRSGS